MCGIFGVAVNSRADIPPGMLESAINSLFTLSESRGKEAAGIAILAGDSIQVYKDALPATTLIRTRAYRKLLGGILERNAASSHNGGAREPLAVIGHSRLVTDGSQELHHNNQPVISEGAVGIHNGIIVNTQALWGSFPSLKRKYEIDTEILLSLLQKFRAERRSLSGAARETFSLIRGATSIAILFEDSEYMLLATNNGSLYVCESASEDIFVFASERYILDRFTGNRLVRRLIGDHEISHVRPGEGYLINVASLERMRFLLEKELSEDPDSTDGRPDRERNVTDVMPEGGGVRPTKPANVITPRELERKFGDDFKRNRERVDSLRRCTKCILPETMPFIDFDEEGVCNFCRGYKKLEIKGDAALMEAVAPYRRSNGGYDCISPISGGRDSTYCLHYVKNVLKMNPLAYTYDWGMVTDLARRNISRICGKLGIEHILISADINKKRRYIRENVLAWLKRPRLGTIPLFMAGDKQYFYYLNKLRKQQGIKLAIYGENRMERTDFKIGFCGVEEKRGQSYADIPLQRKLKLALFYGKEFLSNPAFLNRSLFDTLFAFVSTYGIQHDYLFLYDYVKWNENDVASLIIREYDWEIAEDTTTTWRIGDGTASFYNYIYYTVSGLTENDTFRSNQIREGMITREKALWHAREENKPRFDSILWYCNTIRINCESTLERINSIPKMY